MINLNPQIDDLAGQLLSLRAEVAHAWTEMRLRSTPLPARVHATLKHLQGVYGDLCALYPDGVPGERAYPQRDEQGCIEALDAIEGRLAAASRGAAQGGAVTAQVAEALDHLCGLEADLRALIGPELTLLDGLCRRAAEVRERV